MIKRFLKLPLNKSCFIFGPRQVGKSTFLKDFFKKESFAYYDLLKTSEYMKFSTNPGVLSKEIEALNQNIKCIIIDEIQRVPDLLNEIHRIIEERKSLHFFLSGSSARKLKRSQANLLAGRALTFYLFPLTHTELKEKFDLDRALNYGTLPSVYLNPNNEVARDTLRSYIETYLEEEIRQEALIRNIGGFLRFLKLAADENGNIISYSNLARETGNERRTVKEFFQILEDTLIGFHLFPYAKSARKKLVQHPKFYFFDTGVQRALSKQISLELEEGTSLYGKAFEHFIILEIMRLSRYLKKDFEFSFYRTSDGAEVDLIVESPTKEVFAIEIKSSSNMDSKTLNGLRSFKEACKRAKLFCVSLVDRRQKQGEIEILPWKQIFNELGLNAF
ncbi:MAG: hypothetical protein A3B68_09615 [Candidatus Melainabacteria bacterium RIFCSPHIGHO2_02_FULL_34_12]|nr:MAG: hypothetical protein A3B68_09615 [Candidatus Melainabacteria bacterium RIFCSPHIGHO2_02_FULL_34_12]